MAVVKFKPVAVATFYRALAMAKAMAVAITMTVAPFFTLLDFTTAAGFQLNLNQN